MPAPGFRKASFSAGFRTRFGGSPVHHPLPPSGFQHSRFLLKTTVSAGLVFVAVRPPERAGVTRRARNIVEHGRGDIVGHGKPGAVEGDERADRRAALFTCRTALPTSRSNADHAPVSQATARQAGLPRDNKIASAKIELHICQSGRKRTIRDEAQ